MGRLFQHLHVSGEEPSEWKDSQSINNFL